MELLNERNILKYLSNELPEARFDLKDGLHVIFAYFTDKLIQILKLNATNEAVILRYFSIINRMTDSKDKALYDVLGTTVFIGLFDEFGGSALFEGYLSPATRELYELNIKLWEEGNNISGLFE